MWNMQTALPHMWWWNQATLRLVSLPVPQLWHHNFWAMHCYKKKICNRELVSASEAEALQLYSSLEHFSWMVHADSNGHAEFCTQPGRCDSEHWPWRVHFHRGPFWQHVWRQDEKCQTGTERVPGHLARGLLLQYCQLWIALSDSVSKVGRVYLSHCSIESWSWFPPPQKKDKKGVLLCLFNIFFYCQIYMTQDLVTFATLICISSSEKNSKTAMKKARNLQKSMEANFGGTEMFRPFEHVYSQKTINGYPRQVRGWKCCVQLYSHYPEKQNHWLSQWMKIGSGNMWWVTGFLCRSFYLLMEGFGTLSSWQTLSGNIRTLPGKMGWTAR